MNRFGLLAATALALAPVPAGADPGHVLIEHPGGGPALVIPPDSPVRFDGFDENGAARFSGRFVLAGAFTYDCPAGCEPGMTEDDVELSIRPEPELAKRLPHWQDRAEGMMVYIGEAQELRRTLVTDVQRERLLAGEMSIHGRVSIVVEGITADFGCDYSPYYSARYVAVDKAPEPVEGGVDEVRAC